MADVKRKVRDQRDAVELLRGLEASGQELAPFCLAHGIDGRSLRCWKTNLARRAAGPSPARTPSLRLIEVSAAPRAISSYRVRIDDIVIELDDNFRDDTLGRLLHLVRAC